MAGYPGTPLHRKLGIMPGHRVAVVGAPDGFDGALGVLPDDVTIKRQARAPVEVILFFTDRATELRRRFPRYRDALTPAGGLWVAWPKRSSGVPTDLDRAVVMEIGLDAGLVDNKVCAIDDTWSALRFVWRVADRP